MMIHKNEDTIHPHFHLPPVVFVFSKPDQSSSPTLPICCTASLFFRICLASLAPS
ncbi:hypothetical protein QBC45DRAFT_317196 [Copromyces sp. CBS 386.78]|nr:hypothetical protein QBC45DRAFT_317196 [Copromyces sp. CBS 386.78]